MEFTYDTPSTPRIVSYRYANRFNPDHTIQIVQRELNQDLWEMRDSDDNQLGAADTLPRLQHKLAKKQFTMVSYTKSIAS